MVNVKKADGRTEPYSREKLIRTCRRLRLSEREAEEVADEIEGKLFEGIATKRILQMMYEYGQRMKAHLGHMTDLREALSLMRPKPDFEKFVALLLEYDGYNVSTNKIVRGKCIEHEIDVIASKGEEVLYVEVKHHTKFHTFTGLGTFLEVNSAFQDLTDGYLEHKHKYAFTKPMVVINTKISDHAMRYSACRGIGALGWEMPEHAGIEYHIHKKFLYPITVIKGIETGALDRLGDSGVFTLKQLVESDQRELSRIARIDINLMRNIVEKAHVILGF